MGDYRYCVGSFVRQAGSGVQTVTGIQDGSGSFTPKAIWLWSSIQTVDGASANGVLSYGLTDGVSQFAVATWHPDALVLGGPQGQIARAFSSSTGCFAVNTDQPTVIQDGAHFSAFGAGSFALSWDGSASPSRYIIHFLAIGGEDVTCVAGSQPAPLATGVQTVSVPGAGSISGVMMLNTLSVAGGSFDVAVIAWANFPRIGWATASGQGATAVNCGAFPTTTTSSVYQRSDRCLLGVTTGAVATANVELDSLSADAFTLNWHGGTGAGPLGDAGFYYLTISGPQISAFTLAQPVSDGITYLPSVFVPGAVCVMGVGQVAEESPVEADIGFSFGASDGTTQAASWFGDVSGVTTQECSGYMSQSSAFVAASTSGTGGATAVHGIGTITSTLPWSVNWTQTDGTARSFLVLAFEGTTPPPVPPPAATVTTNIRWERVSPHLTAEQVRTIYDMFQVDAQFVGTVDCPNPVMVLQYSDDGGYTWSNEIELMGGQPGDYLAQFKAFQLGQARDRVFKVWSDAPVPTTLLAAYLRTRKGTS